jgi:hypothetical protein
LKSKIFLSRHLKHEHWCFHFEGVYQTHDLNIHYFGKKQFCVKLVTQLQISKISIKTSKEWTLTFSLEGCLSDTWFEYSSFMCVDKDLWKLKLFLPNTTVTKCYICEWTFKSLLMKKPQSDFFRVWTSFMFVDKDLWKLKLFLPNKRVTKCYICEWIFKSCLIKIHKVTSLEYELVLCFTQPITLIRILFGW